MTEVRSLDAETSNKDQIECDYDINNNLIYAGFSRSGALTTDPLWKIQKITYDASNNLLTAQWASGSPTYQFIWSSRTGYTYS